MFAFGMNFLQILLGFLCIYCLKNTEQCSPPEGWYPLNPEKRAEKAKIVVFGTVVSIPKRSQNSGEDGRFYTVRLHIHCIVKGPQLPPFISVAGFSEFSGGLCVHSNAFLNKTYIMFIERKDDSNQKEFRVLEINLQKGSFHPGPKLSILRDIMHHTGVNATLPTGVKNDSKPGCPDFPHKFQEPPAPHRFKQNKLCRCRKKKLKKQKRKKRKRNKGTSWPRKKVMNIRNITEVPTLPRTRRYSVIHFKQDKVAKENIMPVSHGETLSNSSTGLHKFVTHWLWLTLGHIIICLLPT